MAATHDGGAARKPLTFRRVQRSRQQGQSLLTVFCSRQMQVRDLSECRTCEHGHGLSIDRNGPDMFQRCSWGDGSQWSANDVGSSVSPLSAIMSAPAITVSEHADLRTVAALFVGLTIGALPVVDARGRAVGIVSKGDVLRAYYEHDEEPAAESASRERAGTIEPARVPGVREVMSHVVFALHPDADVRRAAAIMAHESVHHIVVASSDGTAVGIVSALDVMAWLARASGYVLAKP
jgi:CBS domain-containing protein